MTKVLFEVENMESFVKDPDCFYKVCTEVFNQYAPRKKKYVHRNNKPFTNKALSKAIIQRAKLRNKLQTKKYFGKLLNLFFQRKLNREKKLL